MSNVGISRHEIDFLFRNARFNLEQIENIGEICRVLGKYLFVDRTILDARANRDIGLSYLQRAVKNHIITEMQHQNNKEKKDVFYYQLGMGGKYLLEKAGETYFDMNILADKDMKGRILTLNYFMLKNGYDISSKYDQDSLHRFFFCKDAIICYFPNIVKEIEIIRMLIRKFSTPDGSPTVEEIRKKFNFIPVEKQLIAIGGKTRTILV